MINNISLTHNGKKKKTGNGVVIHLPGLFDEIKELEKGGDIDYRNRLKISDRAHVLFDFHQSVDGMSERDRGRGAIGTTKKGIGPCYATKATRNAVRMGDLKDWNNFLVLYETLATATEQAYPGFKVDREAELKKLKPLAERLIKEEMIVDTSVMIHDYLNRGKRVLAEGANAVMLDLDHGTYPYVTSSSTTAGKHFRNKETKIRKASFPIK